jgi:hypothetical protein
MRYVITAAIILHNIIVEEERNKYRSHDYLFEDDDYVPPIITQGQPIRSDWVTQRSRLAQSHNHVLSRQFQADLVDHIWTTMGDAADIDL